jgi:hypothetical protein
VSTLRRKAERKNEVVSAVAAACALAAQAQAALECGPVAASVTCAAAAYPVGIDYFITPIGTLQLVNPALNVSGNGVQIGPRDTAATTPPSWPISSR